MKKGKGKKKMGSKSKSIGGTMAPLFEAKQKKPESDMRYASGNKLSARGKQRLSNKLI